MSIIAPFVQDKISACFTTGVAQYTYFLTPEELNEALPLVQYSGCHFQLWGGFEQAERQMIGIAGEQGDFEFPITVLRGRWDKFGNITHRDILGALMASGMERKYTGDIVMASDERTFYAAVHSRMVDFILGNITAIGRCSVVLEPVYDLSEVPPLQFSERKISVSSLRADCVISALLNVSRSDCQQLILQKKAFINHALIIKPTVQIKVGDSVVVRGYGKFVLEEICGLSKKGKTYILVKQFR